jgi:hypothetical protein
VSAEPGVYLSWDMPPSTDGAAFGRPAECEDSTGTAGAHDGPYRFKGKRGSPSAGLFLYELDLQDALYFVGYKQPAQLQDRIEFEVELLAT